MQRESLLHVVHKAVIRPSLAAGSVYCESPLGQDLPHVADLAQLARE
jgi:predicted dehydrogenase